MSTIKIRQFECAMKYFKVTINFVTYITELMDMDSGRIKTTL